MAIEFHELDTYRPPRRKPWLIILLGVIAVGIVLFGILARGCRREQPTDRDAGATNVIVRAEREVSGVAETDQQGKISFKDIRASLAEFRALAARQDYAGARALGFSLLEKSLSAATATTASPRLRSAATR